MSAIYVDRKDAALEHDGGALIVRVDGAKVASIPLTGAQRVVLRRAGTVSPGLLAALGERNIGLLVLSGRKGEPKAHMLGAPHGDASVRLGQFRLALDRATALRLARLPVRAKIAGHSALVADLLAVRPDLRKPLMDSAAELDSAGVRAAAAPELDVLRGHEGAAAASFFRAYVGLFAPALGFAERNRRPPRDPVNAALSLAYTLLHAEAVRASWIAGLDPYVGFLHDPLAGRKSLACDLVEFCRPAADRWVWQLFRDRILRADHFSVADGACLMGKAGRAAFYDAFETMVLPERRRLRHVAAGLARAARAAHRGDA